MWNIILWILVFCWAPILVHHLYTSEALKRKHGKPEFSVRRDYSMTLGIYGLIVGVFIVAGALSAWKDGLRSAFPILSFMAILDVPLRYNTWLFYADGILMANKWLPVSDIDYFQHADGHITVVPKKGQKWVIDCNSESALRARDFLVLHGARVGNEGAAV